MVGLLQLKLPTSTLVGFLINGLIMNLLQHIFFASGESRFSIPKIKRSDFLCVSPTFASPIEKPATSAHRRICREIIENTEGNAKTVDSLRRCNWPNSDSKSAPETKKPTGGPVGGESKKWWSWWLCSGTPIAPQNPVFLSIPRSSLALYSTSSTGFRFPFYGEKTGKIPFSGEEMGNFCMPINQSPNRESNLLPCQFEDK